MSENWEGGLLALEDTRDKGIRKRMKTKLHVCVSVGAISAAEGESKGRHEGYQVSPLSLLSRWDSAEHPVRRQHVTDPNTGGEKNSRRKMSKKQ